MNKQNKKALIDTEKRLVVTRGTGDWGMGEGSPLYGGGW